MITSEFEGTGGKLRVNPEDFVVEEIPAYEPSGQGDHIFLRIRKTNLTTDDIAHKLAKIGQVRSSDVGFAGRKDKYAVTTQWFSVRSDRSPETFEDLEGPQIAILETSRHTNKIRTGHLRGNRFSITIRETSSGAHEKALKIIEKINSQGLPNLFGYQRFGKQGKNVTDAIKWLTGASKAPKKKHIRKLLISSLQASLFNTLVRTRLDRGLFTVPLEGDIMKKHGTGGMFVAESVEEAAPRIISGEISPTGPIYGAKMWWPESQSVKLEKEVLEMAGLSEDDLEKFKKDGKGTRRLIRVFPQDVSAEEAEDSLVVNFSLDSGSYATTFLAEIMKDPELMHYHDSSNNLMTKATTASEKITRTTDSPRDI